tara:strand:+ start:85 stop:426 length:342 start_codon:yes stop_codon:yes gene_type:complete
VETNLFYLQKRKRRLDVFYSFISGVKVKDICLKYGVSKMTIVVDIIKIKFCFLIYEFSKADDVPEKYYGTKTRVVFSNKDFFIMLYKKYNEDYSSGRGVNTTELTKLKRRKEK